MKKKSLLTLMSFLLVLSMFLVACSGGKDTSKDDSNKGSDPGKTEEPKDEGPVEGGTLVFATNSEFDGLLDPIFSESTGDSDILGFTHESLITYDENLKPQPHLAEWKTDDNKVFYFTFKKGVKWHDGKELTVDDWIFAIETIAKIGPEHARWSNVNTIEGAVEFNEGKADSISGLKKVNDYEIEVTFKEAAVNNLDNLWVTPMSRAYFEGVDPKDMASSEKVRNGSIGTGPYKFSKVLPGESVELVRNEEYWDGKPYIEKIIIKVIDTSVLGIETKGGKVDLLQIPAANLEEFQAYDNIDIKITDGLSYYYVGFKLGTFKDGKVVMDKDKYASKELRQAMLYAIDREKWIKSFFSGLAQPLDTVIPKAHWIAATSNELPNKYTYDPDKAKELLDKAGYVDRDNDGWREDPNGNKFVIKFAHYQATNPTFPLRAQAIADAWKEIGLNTEVSMIDSKLYYDMVQKDDPAIEVFFGGWSTGTDPDPWGLWGDDVVFNYPRWYTEESGKLMKDAVNIDVVGTDANKRKELYVKWQSIINEELPMLPIMETQTAWGVNKRVQDVKLDVLGYRDPHKWWIKPEK